MQTTPVPAPVLPPPTALDYFLILCGAALSMLLAELSGLRSAGLDTSAGLARALHAVLPQALFLPMGIVLFWPIFFSLQQLFGRQLGMTLGECLWGVAWLANLFFAAWFFWNGVATLPGFLAFKEQIVIAYLLFLLAMATIALILFLVGLVRRTPMPWTHRFAVALLSWPIVPLLAMWLQKITFA